MMTLEVLRQFPSRSYDAQIPGDAMSHVRTPAPETAGPERLALVGSSELMGRLRTRIQVIAPHMRTALISAEPGLGAEMVAEDLHRYGAVSEGALLKVTAVALNAVIEERGFSGFRASVEGAAGGSLYVQEVGELSTVAQQMLLELLRQPANRPGMMRVLASSSRPLKAQVAAGAFAAELLYRLATVVIAVPALRERAEDLPELVMLAVDEIARQYGGAAPVMAEAAMQQIGAHSWPGNLLELESVLRQLVLESEADVISAEQVAAVLQERAPVLAEAVQVPDAGSPVRLQAVIDRHLLEVVQQCGGNKLRAAEVLGVSRSTLYRMLEAAVEHRGEEGVVRG